MSVERRDCDTRQSGEDDYNFSMTAETKARSTESLSLSPSHNEPVGREVGRFEVGMQFPRACRGVMG